MSAADLKATVIEVLEGQSPDYAIFPNAAAFAVEGLDPEEVAGVLADLEAEGAVEREQLLLDPEDDSATTPGGYRLTSTK